MKSTILILLIIGAYITMSSSAPLPTPAELKAKGTSIIIILYYKHINTIAIKGAK